MCLSPTFTVTKHGSGGKEGMVVIFTKKDKVPPVQASDMLNSYIKDLLEKDSNARIVILCETRKTAKLLAIRASCKGMKSAAIIGPTFKGARTDILEKHRLGDWKILCITPKLTLCNPPVASHVLAFQMRPETFTLEIR